MSLHADYYDGKSTRRHSVIVHLEGERLRISGDGIERNAGLHELRISEPLGGAPRLLTFPDRAFCEIRDQAGLETLLQQTGFRDHFVVRWQYSLLWIAISAGLCLAIFLAGYRWGLPWVSEKLAAEMPELALQSVSDQVLSSLDSHFLAPSKLSTSRQEELSARFAALRPPEGNPVSHRVIFRSNRSMRANAIALPSGTIILTDDLVTLSTNDNELMAVLAHELGHIHDRHGMRLVLQGSIVGIIAAWFIGDISSAIAAAPAALLQARYSRDFEHDADTFAARMLENNAISPQCLADILWRMENSHQELVKGESGSKFNDYLSSHPATDKRLVVLHGRACE